MVKRLVRHLPVTLLMTMGLASLVRPRTRGWGRARAAIGDYVAERRAADRRAVGLVKDSPP